MTTDALPAVPALPTARGPVPRSFHLLAKPTGAICNLDCSYCFFLSKESLYPGSPFRMADDVLERYLRQLVEAHAGAPEVTVAWQGGEPTMIGIDFFRRSVELVAQVAAPGRQVVHTIQTNATLVDDDWAEFFAEHGFLVGVSIDGPGDVHDTYRVDKGGKPTFHRVLTGLRVLQRHDVDWNALTTVNTANEDRGLEVYRFLRDDLGASYIQFIPIVEVASSPGRVVSDRSVSRDGYGRFLVDVFEDWVRHDVGRVFVQIFDAALGQWLGIPPSLCVHAVRDRYGDEGLNYLCPSYTDFFAHVDGRMRQMRELIRRGEDPAAVMSLVALEDVARDPSAACPCGRDAPWPGCHAAFRTDSRRTVSSRPTTHEEEP